MGGARTITMPEELVSSIVDRYKVLLDQQEQEELDKYLYEIIDELIELIGKDQAENIIIERIKKFIDEKEGLVGDDALEKYYKLSESKEPNQIIKLIQAIDKHVQGLLDNNEEKIDKDILIPVNKLKRMGEKLFIKEVLSPVSDTAADDVNKAIALADSLKKLLHIATATIASIKSYQHAHDMLDFNYWLEHQIMMRNTLLHEIKKRHNIREDIQKGQEGGIDANLIEKGKINRFYKIIFPTDKVKVKNEMLDVALLPISKFRSEMEKKLPYDEEFRKLSDKEQEIIINELELKHLKTHLKKCEENIRVRLSAERNNLDKKEVKKLIGEDPRLNLDKIFKSPMADDSKKNDEIKLNLKRVADKKRKKLIARIFTLIGVGLGIGLVIAGIAAAPGVVLVGLAAGVACSLMIAKCINSEDSLQEISKKGVSYFTEKIHLLFNPGARYQKKYQAEPVGHEKTRERRIEFNKSISKKAFIRYRKKVKEDEVDRIAAVAAETEVKELGTGAEKMVSERLESIGSGVQVTQSPEIRKSKQYKKVHGLMGHLQTLDRHLSQTYSALPMPEINQAADQIGSCVSDIAENSDVTIATKLASKISLTKFKKAAGRVLAMAALTTASAYKCIRAQSALNFEIWLKQQLVGRYVLQKELEKINQFLINHKNDLRDLKGKPDNYFIDKFDLFFSKIEQEEAQEKKSQDSLYDLSLTKFRKKLIDKLAQDEDFIKMSDNDQVYFIAKMEDRFLSEKITRVENNMLARANVEMDLKDEAARFKLDDGIKSSYLRYDNKNAFGEKLSSAIKSPKPNADDHRINNAIVMQLKDNFKIKQRKLISRGFLLLFAGLSLAALLAGFALAPIPVIAALTVGALACVVIAKLVKKDESMTDIFKKGFSGVSQKVKKQFTLWDVKKEMSTGQDAVPTPSLSPKFSGGG